MKRKALFLLAYFLGIGVSWRWCCFSFDVDAFLLRRFVEASFLAFAVSDAGAVEPRRRRGSISQLEIFHEFRLAPDEKAAGRCVFKMLAIGDTPAMKST